RHGDRIRPASAGDLDRRARPARSRHLVDWTEIGRDDRRLRATAVPDRTLAACTSAATIRGQQHAIGHALAVAGAVVADVLDPELGLGPHVATVAQLTGDSGAEHQLLLGL